MQLFFRNKITLAKELFDTRGPLLIVANHPNSFLDAIIIGATCKYPVHFLARGDAFRKKHHRILLAQLQMIPIYRMREGRSQLYLNASSFVRTQEVLNNNGIVLIFIEGICVNTHELQPFQKGAARIVMEYKGVNPLRILPVCIRYEEIPAVYKKVFIAAGTLFDAGFFLKQGDTLAIVRNFNTVIHAELTGLLWEGYRAIHSNIKTGSKIRYLLKLLVAPVYWLVHKFVYLFTKGTVFFDSVLFGILLFVLPVWFLLLVRIIFYLFIKV